MMLRSPARFQAAAKALVELYRKHRQSADRDPCIRAAVLRAWMEAEAYTLSTYRTASRLDRGGSIGPESSTNKVFWSELDQNIYETAQRILGPAAELLPLGPEPGVSGHWMDGFLHAHAGKIYAGANEIQRNIIAERMLGMPRS